MISGAAEKLVPTNAKKEPKPVKAVPFKAVKGRPKKTNKKVAKKKSGKTNLASIVGLIKGSTEGISLPN